MAKIYTSASSSGVAKSVAAFVLKHQNDAIANSGSFKLAVSGGSMGKVLKAGLVDNENAKGKVQWDKWEIFFSDERLVPLDHADSNYGLLNESVLKYIRGAKPKVHAIDTSLITGIDGQVDGSDTTKDEQIAEKYAQALPADLKLDLVLLGCGPDGHTCSLFPGHTLLKEAQKTIALITDSPKFPPRRISFTFPVLAKAGSIAFIAEGEGKAPIIDEIFNDPKSKLPCKLVNELDVPVAWFVNDAALTGITVRASKY